MTGDERGSITGWLGNLREGDQAAAQPLWERYFSKLVVVARTKLKRMRRTTADEDEEDAALERVQQLLRGAARGQFPQLADRDDLWRLLVVITARKAMAQANRQGRQKRGGGRVVDEAVLFGKGLEGGEGSIVGLELIAAAGPTPEFAAMMAEECRRLLDALGDDVAARRSRSPDGRIQQRRDRRPARLRAPNRRAAARPDPQDLDDRGDGLMADQLATRADARRARAACAASITSAKNSRPAGAPASAAHRRVARRGRDATTGAPCSMSSSSSRSSSAAPPANRPRLEEYRSRFPESDGWVEAAFAQAAEPRAPPWPIRQMSTPRRP